MRSVPIHKIIERNEQAGHHFFEPDTLRFFRSRYSQYAYEGDGGTYFVTSERYSADSPRLYSVRQQHNDGSIDTIGEFQQYQTRDAAHRVAKQLAEGGQS